MRNDINNKPHEVLWLGLAVILGFAFIFPCDKLDFQFHDTYIAMTPMQVASIFVFSLGLLGGIYALTVRAEKKLTKWMTMFHVAFSLFFTITLIYAGCEEGTLTPLTSPRLGIAVLVFILAQVAFIINIVYAFQKK